jgi:hypothetical protein
MRHGEAPAPIVKPSPFAKLTPSLHQLTPAYERPRVCLLPAKLVFNLHFSSTGELDPGFFSVFIVVASVLLAKRSRSATTT